MQTYLPKTRRGLTWPSEHEMNRRGLRSHRRTAPVSEIDLDHGYRNSPTGA
jgi:hypothetical protein